MLLVVNPMLRRIVILVLVVGGVFAAVWYYNRPPAALVLTGIVTTRVRRDRRLGGRAAHRKVLARRHSRDGRRLKPKATCSEAAPRRRAA
jgi:hypothetical protein